jgi:hypothetical protein
LQKTDLSELRFQYADPIYAQNMATMSIVRSDEYRQCHLDRLHRGYLSSIKTLAQICKLDPAAQINIAEKQSNMAQAR